MKSVCLLLATICLHLPSQAAVFQNDLLCQNWLLPKTDAGHIPTFLIGQMPVIESERLILRSFDKGRDSLEDLHQLVRNPDINIDFGISGKRGRHQREFRALVRDLERGVYRYPEFQEYLRLALVIVEKNSNKIIGVFGIGENNSESYLEGDKKIPYSTIEIGFALEKSYRGKGYAAEASLAVADEIGKRGGRRHFSAFTSRTNEACLKVLEKLGMTRWYENGNTLYFETFFSNEGLQQ